MSRYGIQGFTGTKHTIEFDDGLTVGRLRAALKEFVKTHPNPREEGRRIEAKVVNGQLVSITVLEPIKVGLASNPTPCPAVPSDWQLSKHEFRAHEFFRGSGCMAVVIQKPVVIGSDDMGKTLLVDFVCGRGPDDDVHF